MTKKTKELKTSAQGEVIDGVVQKRKGPDDVGFMHVPDSITLKVNAKGEKAWDIKIYYDSKGGTDNEARELAIKHLANVHNDMVETFEEEE